MIRANLLRLVLVGLFVAVLPQLARAQGAAALPAGIACESLSGGMVGELRVADAAVVSEGRPAPACHVRGTIESTIGFEAWLPQAAWTGRYLQLGCGGLCGRIETTPQQAFGCAPAERGAFAVATSDLGHRDPSAASWGDDPERRMNFAFRANHLTAVAAKALIQRYYGQPAKHAYFTGCSDGGREGLMEALRYPDDFDGIMAGAPAMNFEVLNTFHHAWTVSKNTGADGRPVLSAERLPVLHRLVLAACDTVGDGVVRDPLACRFDPLAAICRPGADPASCLTDAEARMAAALRDGARMADGTRMTTGGMMWGSEANWLGTEVPAPGAATPRALMFATGVLRYLAFWPNPPADYQVTSLAFDRPSYARIAASQAIFDATNPDLSAYVARGGKLILWHGWADPDISPTSTLAYWAALHQTLGDARAEGFARLFMIPGLAHCRGGVGATTFDALSPLLRWVEEGAAPERLEARVPGGTLVQTLLPQGVTAPESWIGDDRFRAAALSWCMGGVCAAAK